MVLASGPEKVFAIKSTRRRPALVGDIVQQVLLVAVLASTADGVHDSRHIVDHAEVVYLGQLALLIMCTPGQERARDTLIVLVLFNDLGQVSGVWLTLYLLLKLRL